MMQYNIYDEYHVTSFDDFKSNFRQIQLLREFLNSSSETICILSGSLCSGKTTLLEIVHSFTEYETIFLTSESAYTDDYKNFCTKRTIENIILGKKKIALVDDVHLLDKPFITRLKNKNKTTNNKTEKIIITVQTKEEAKISELKAANMKSDVLYIKLNNITFQDCFITVNELLEKLSLDTHIACDQTISIIKENNCNLRQTLQYLSKKCADTPDPTIKANIHDMNIYDLTLFYLKNKIDEKFLSINMTNMVTCLIYENFTKLFPLKGREKNNVISNYKEFLKNTIVNNNDTLQKENPQAFKIFEHFSMYKTNCMLIDNKANDNTSLKFTNIFNKLSMQSSLNKKINASHNQNDFSPKPLIQSMCCANTEDPVYKKMCTDFK
jgi:hypothetical protein